MPGKGRLGRWMIFAALSAAAAGLCGWRLWSLGRLRASIAEARREIQEARFATARRDLERLSAAHPGEAEITYLLGLCERRTGRADAAANLWSRVPPGTPFASEAIQGRMELEVERGRLAEAERIVEQAASDPRMDGTGLRLYLGQIYSQEGRIQEAREIIEARWEHLNGSGEGTSEAALNLLRLSIELRETLPPVDQLRAFLDEMSRLAPEDDRVRLGRANLAIRTGAFQDADRLLRECERIRPDDFAVSHARLDWAIATDHVEEALQAFRKLPPRRISPAEVGRFAARFFRKRGLRDREREALEVLIRADPTDSAARTRWIELAPEDDPEGRPDAVRAEAAEIERLKPRFLRLHRRNQPLRDAAELGRLAARLGYWLEARGYLTLAAEANPDRPEGRDALRDLESTLRDLEARRGALLGEISGEIGP